MVFISTATRDYCNGCTDKINHYGIPIMEESMSKKSDQEFLNHLQEKLAKGENIFPIGKDEYGAEVITADQVIPKQQPWFWKNVIPLDTTTLFAGFGSSGKSQLLIFLAAHVSNGIPFNGGGLSHQLPKGGVIILSGEDDFSYQLTPRLIAAGATLSNCHLVKMMKAPGKPKMLLDLDAHLHLLEEVILKKKDTENPIKLIIVDPVQYFTGDMKDHIGSRVCRFIDSLNELSKEHSLSTIMNKHLRKKGSGDGISSAVDAVAGSGAWTTSPRACWLIQRHPEKLDAIVFADLKGNLKAKDTKSLAFRIDQTTINDGAITTTALTWFDELENLNADEALNTVAIPPKEQAVRKWIINFLLECNKKSTNGAMFSSSQLLEEALAEGHAQMTYYRTRAKMLEEGIITQVEEGRHKKVTMIKLNDAEMYN
jgi:RecA-family ATPase